MKQDKDTKESNFYCVAQKMQNNEKEDRKNASHVCKETQKLEFKTSLRLQIN